MAIRKIKVEALIQNFDNLLEQRPLLSMANMKYRNIDEFTKIIANEKIDL